MLYWWWTDQAITKYEMTASDAVVHDTIEDLIRYIEDDSSRGIKLADLKSSTDPWDDHAWYALAGRHLPPDSRVVMVNIPGKRNRRGEPVLAIAVHLDGSPDPLADQTLLWLEVY